MAAGRGGGRRGALGPLGRCGGRSVVGTTVEPSTYRRPSTFIRWFARTPELAFRIGLGSLFGRRLCLPTQVGRTSGLTRRTVLEVVEEDRGRRTVLVASGVGVSPWLRNLRATPPLRLDIGSEHWVPAVRELGPEERAGTSSSAGTRALDDK